MRHPRFLDLLHVRVTALFLLLLAISVGAYFLWIRATLLQPPESTADTDAWWHDTKDAEIDSLSRDLAPRLDDPVQLTHALVQFGDHVRPYEAEVAVVDTSGSVVSSSDPDSLDAAIGELDPDLLHAMAQPDWDYESYPDPTSFDSYVNRIFAVVPLSADAERGGPDAYLVASFLPVTVTPADLQTDFRHLWFQAIVIMLTAGALSGIIVMMWISRRVHVLADGVSAFADGEYSRRVPARSRDDIGRLGRDFNSMASRLEALIVELRNKETFQRQLIANISHDLRSPMAALGGYVETLVLKADTLSPAQRDQYLEIISGNLDHLGRLIDHLLQLSRLDAGQARFQMEDFALAELLDGVLARCQPAAERKSVTLRTEMPDDLPNVHADPLQIAQVLQNLVDNGIKFNRPGGEVVIAAEPRADRVRISVRDNGEGIAPEVLPHIFDRFYTGDISRHRKGESNGLGLAISQKIVQGHDGEIEVTSRHGEGSAFAFTLPAALRARGAEG